MTKENKTLSEKREKLDKKGRWESYSEKDLYFYPEEPTKFYLKNLKKMLKDDLHIKEEDDADALINHIINKKINKAFKECLGKELP